MAMPMPERDFVLFTQYVAQLCGMSFDETKRYLFEARLDAVRRDLGFANYLDLLDAARADTTEAIGRIVVDAVSTHETSFFRDEKVFELMRHRIVPELLGADPYAPLSIWSAGCSAGQESYSVAMVLESILFDLAKAKVRIHGSDLSERAVNAANLGEFTLHEVGRGLDARHLTRYFTPKDRNFRIRDDLRSICRFEVENILAPHAKGPFDIILCRNVLIYFALDQKRTIVANLVKRLRQGGVLVVGATESLIGVSDELRRVEENGASYYVHAIR